MQGTAYTLARWKVRPGREREFVRAWHELGHALARLAHPPGIATLVQSLDDPDVYYSFGPWADAEDILEMREDPRAQQAFARMRALCDDAPGGAAYRLVAHSGEPSAR